MYGTTSASDDANRSLVSIPIFALELQVIVTKEAVNKHSFMYFGAILQTQSFLTRLSDRVPCVTEKHSGASNKVLQTKAN